MLTPPLPWTLTGAELRLVDTVLSVSAHNLTIRFYLTAERAAMMREALGQQAGESVLLRPDQGGAELCKIGWGARGVRAWCGSVEVRRPIPFAWFDFLGREELAAREKKGVVHVA